MNTYEVEYTKYGVGRIVIAESKAEAIKLFQGDLTDSSAFVRCEEIKDKGIVSGYTKDGL